MSEHCEKCGAKMDPLNSSCTGLHYTGGIECLRNQLAAMTARAEAAEDIVRLIAADLVADPLAVQFFDARLLSQVQALANTGRLPGRKELET